MELFFSTIYVFLWLLSHACVVAQDTEQAYRILKDKLPLYNKALRPVRKVTSTIEVNMTFGIISIQDFDEVQEKISLGGYLGLVWTDQMFTWNASEYGGMAYFHTEATQFWRPPIVNINTAQEMTTLGADWTPMTVTSYGFTYYYPAMTLTVMCNVNVLYYPFDTQECQVVFSVWGFLESQVRLRPMSSAAETSFYIATGPFRIVDSNLTYIGDNAVACFIKLERKPEFLLVVFVVPIIMLALLNTLVFFIPTEGGERISYCLTVLLSLAVFLTLVADNLPKTSNPLSLFSFYLVAILMLSVIITLTTIASMRLYFRDDDEAAPGAFWTGLYRCFTCKGKTRRYVNAGNNDSTGRSSSAHEFSTLASSQDGSVCQRSNNMGTNGRVYQMQLSGHNSQNYRDYVDGGDISEHARTQRHKHAEDIRTSKQPNEIQDSKPIKWKDISIMMDMVFFTVFVLLIVALTVILGIIVGLNK